MKTAPIPRFFLLPLSRRIVGLDLVRGCAILAMTAYHQSLVNRPAGDWRLFAEFLGYASAPLFLVVSGVSAALHERRHRRPLKMMVHGGLLFLMAYVIDLVLTRDPRVDWDIFQVIGACYAGLGLSGHLGRWPRKHLALAAVLLLVVVRPELRPDKGFFSPWPYGFYFAGGYFAARLGLSPWLRRWSIRGLAAASLGFFLLDFSWNPPPDRTQPEGFIFILALALALLLAALEAERRGRLRAPGIGALVRCGRYPLTLYFAQQIAAVAHLRLPLPLTPTAAWAVQSTLLLALMCAAAAVMERQAFLDAGWWLRQVEQRVLGLARAEGVAGRH